MGDFNYTDENGIWVRVTKYSHPNPSMPTLTLLPMIHIGEKEFFREMNYEMWCHDVAFLEGCHMPARKLFHLFHRLFGASSGLSLQSGKLPFWKRLKRESKTHGQAGLTEIHAKSGCNCGKCYQKDLLKIRADLHRWHALKAFKAIPLWAKLGFPFLILAVLIAAPFLNLRDHNVKSDEPEESDDDFFDRLTKPFRKFAIDDRDLFLRMVIAEEIIKPRHAAKRLCVKYGSKHMPALAETVLADFGYKLAQSRNVLAVKKTKGMEISPAKAGYGIAEENYWEEVDIKTEQFKTKFNGVTTSYPQDISIGLVAKPSPVSFVVQADYSRV